MSDISRLATALMALDDKLVTCMKCGLCQAVCPVFGETFMEADVTRGKIALLDNLAHNMITDAKGVDDKLNRCLLCGSCQANCPSGVTIMNIFMDARAMVATYHGMPALKKLIFRTLLPNASLFNFAMRMATPFQGLVMRKEKTVQQTCSMPMFSRLVGDRHINALPSPPLHVRVGKVDTPAGKSGLKVLFYPGCMTDKMYPQIGEAVLKVLAHHGVGVVIPEGLTCCGMPALASGDRAGFEKQALVNLDVIDQAMNKTPFDYIVTPCSSCTATLAEWWPHFSGTFHKFYQDVTAKIAPKTMDISAFLVDVLKVETPVAEAKASARKLTYHDSCHLKKSLKVTEQPRKLLQANSDYQLVEMKEADRCCGCGGSFTLFHYDLSKKIGMRKRGNVVKSGAEMVATGCPACMMQLTDMLSQNKDPITVKHTIEVYADSII